MIVEVSGAKVVLRVEDKQARYDVRWQMKPAKARTLATALWRCARWLDAQAADEAVLLAQAEAELDDMLKGTG